MKIKFKRLLTRKQAEKQSEIMLWNWCSVRVLIIYLLDFGRHYCIVMYTVWRVEFGKLAVETKALNLGQGFPDYMPPSVVTDALKQVACSSNPLVHQYTRSYVSNIDHFSQFHSRPVNGSNSHKMYFWCYCFPIMLAISRLWVWDSLL